ncbi:hypothetical protein B0H17DRAFT_1075769 [Mycena rosella]|uniref:Uncharacterized protein n=1 Tax=Mycena rosella TaxID=1033263 RepID=A0AAD7D6Y8_MYCRO|nr:hypothetical protein B0H17DRAFT_1075769 [Mycena rosella]
MPLGHTAVMARPSRCTLTPRRWRFCACPRPRRIIRRRRPRSTHHRPFRNSITRTRRTRSTIPTPIHTKRSMRDRRGRSQPTRRIPRSHLHPRLRTRSTLPPKTTRNSRPTRPPCGNGPPRGHTNTRGRTPTRTSRA